MNFAIFSTLNHHAVPLSQFLEKPMPKYRFDVFLFLRPEHLQLQKSEDVWLLYAENKQEITILMSIFIENGVAYSPWRMSFGGIVAQENVPYAHLASFVDFVLEFCKQQHIKELQIISYPFSYAPNVSHLCTQIFLQKGFEIIGNELTHFLDIQEDFTKNLHVSARRRLQKCKKNDFRFEHWSSPDLPWVYEFVAKSRQRKNYPITMPYDHFEHTLRSNSDKYLVFVVKKEEEITALTVAIIINSEILYNFYPADSEQYLSFSPTVMLLEGVYRFAQQRGFRIFDLGISTQNSCPNQGLIHFKEKMGCKSALKLSFLKKITV